MNAANKYDLILIPFGSFSLLPDELVHRSLRNMKAALKPNGRLLLTIVIKHRVATIDDWVETRRHRFDKEWIVESMMKAYDEPNNRLVTKLKYELLAEGEVRKTEYMDFPVRCYDADEFVRTLRINGFDNVKSHEVKDGYGEGQHFSVYECSSLHGDAS